MPMQRAMLILSVMVGLLMTPIVLSQKAGRAELRFQEAHRKETIDGDMKSAIDLYRLAIDEAGGNRAIAAQALVRVGQCYEKLGDVEARKAYERVVRDFGDQKDPAETARARLAALGGDGPVLTAASPTVRKLAVPAMQGKNCVIKEISPNGRYFSCAPGGDYNLYVREVESGKERQLTAYSEGTEAGRIWRTEYLDDPVWSVDGKWLAYICPQSRNEMLNPKTLCLWSVDGAQLRQVTLDKSLRLFTKLTWPSKSKTLLAETGFKPSPTFLVTERHFSI